MELPGSGRRLLISGQIGLNPDNTIADGLEAQMRCAWRNLFAIVSAAGMGKRNIVKVTVFVTDPDVKTTALYRSIRDELLEGHAPTSTYLVVAGLANPDLLVEIEAEAFSP